MEKKVVLSACVALSLVAVTNCSSDNPVSEVASSVAGKVIDGYIQGATVCLDKNKNLQCDKDEPSTTTQSDGSYELKVSNKEDLNYKIIAYDGINTVTNKRFNALLQSSPSNKNITPLTTLQEQLKEKGLSDEEAKQKLATLLSIEQEDIAKDYIVLATKKPQLLKAALKIEKTAELINPTNPLQGYETLVESIQKGAQNFDEVLEKSPLDESKKSNIKTLLAVIDKLESKNLEENIEVAKEKIIQAEKQNITLTQDELLNTLQTCILNPNLDDSSFTDTPPNNGKDIPYFTIGEQVSDIEAAFNRARALDSTINTPLELPSEEVWKQMSPEEQALYVLNKERVERGLKPFEGVEAMNLHFSGGEPKTLSDVAQAYANLLYTKKELSHTLDGTVTQRIERVESIKNNKEPIPYNESLYASGNSFQYESIPLIKAIYNWIYADSNPAAGEPWGHRAMCLMKVDNDNFGEKGAEGILAFGLKQGENYVAYPGFKSSIVVMNAFNPTATWSGDYKKLTLCKGINLKDDRFERLFDGTIKDTKTNLIWQDINLTKGTQEDLESFCSSLTLAGYTNWRAPNASELSSYYQEALKVGVTPNLSQINISTLTAKDGFVFTQEGAKKYKKALGAVTTDFSATHIGDIRCVVGEEKNQEKTDNLTGSIQVDTQSQIAIDTESNLAFINKPKLAGRLNNYYGEIACNNLELGGYSDWRLPTASELSLFHKKVATENVKLNYYASYCTYETTNEESGTSYKAVRVQKSDDNYAIGDIVTFTGSSGVRCVRDNKEQDTTQDTQPPKQVTISYNQDDLRELKESQNGITTNIYLKIDLDGDCDATDNNKYLCPSISFDIIGEANTKAYRLDKLGALSEELGTLDENGKLQITIDETTQEYSYLESEIAGNRYSSLFGEVVLVDENNNISLPVNIWINFFPKDKN